MGMFYLLRSFIRQLCIAINLTRQVTSPTTGVPSFSQPQSNKALPLVLAQYIDFFKILHKHTTTHKQGNLTSSHYRLYYYYTHVHNKKSMEINHTHKNKTIDNIQTAPSQI